MTVETLDWGDADESACHKMIRFIPLTGTWWLYRMVSVCPPVCVHCHTNHHRTSIPCAAFTLCDSGTWNHTSCFDGCSCFAQNLTVNVFGSSFWQTRYVFVLMQPKHVWLIRQFYKVVYRGQNLCGHEGEIERRGLRERERERKRERERAREREIPAKDAFSLLTDFFPLPVIKKS